jgi:hypothetical protein
MALYTSPLSMSLIRLANVSNIDFEGSGLELAMVYYGICSRPIPSFQFQNDGHEAEESRTNSDYDKLRNSVKRRTRTQPVP